MIHNGMCDNIAVFGRLSDSNLVQSNTVTDSAGMDEQVDAVGPDIHFNAFIDISNPALPDRGAPLVANQVIGNTVLRAYANGISNRSSSLGLG